MNRYKQFFGMNTSDMQSILKLYPGTYTNVEIVTESIMLNHNSHWVEAIDKAVLQVYDESSRLCVVKGMESHETIVTAFIKKKPPSFPQSIHHQKIFVFLACIKFLSSTIGYDRFVFMIPTDSLFTASISQITSFVSSFSLKPS